MKNRKKLLLKMALFSGIALLTNAGCKNRDKTTDDNDEDETELVIEKQTDRFAKKYKIDTRADFDTLYNDAKPFIFASLISTENWRTDFHNDKQKTNALPNSVGVGLYYLGVDKNGKLDFNVTGNWKMTKDYVSAYRASHKGANPPALTQDQLYEGSIAWFQNMEHGRHLKELFNHLQGAELTINEFAAIASVYYNDPAIGRNLCDVIKNNYTDAQKCANAILNTKIKMDGIEQRRVHEVLVYLNYDNYCTDLFELQVDGHLNTSTGAGKSYYKKLKAKNGLNDANLSAAKKAICDCTVTDGHTIRYYVSMLRDKDAILAFASPKAKSKHKTLYEAVQSKYRTKDYPGALRLYQQTLKRTGNHNDNR